MTRKCIVDWGLIRTFFKAYELTKVVSTRYVESVAHELDTAKIYTLFPNYVDTLMLRELQTGRDFDWDTIIKVPDVAGLSVALAEGEYGLASGPNFIVANNKLKDDMKSVEKLDSFHYVYKSLHSVLYVKTSLVAPTF